MGEESGSSNVTLRLPPQAEKSLTEAYSEAARQSGIQAKLKHFVSAACRGERCSICGAPASHKVGEEIMADDPFDSVRHSLTAYVCCRHFRKLMGPAAACERKS